MHHPNCDGENCTSNSGEIRALPYCEDGNLLLCHACYLVEIEDRQIHNRTHCLPDDTCLTWNCPSWESLTIYEANVAPTILYTKSEKVTYTVEVAYHEWMGEPLPADTDRDDVFDSLEDAIKEWDFGSPRIGAHNWDEEACHVMQCPVTKKFILLYL